MGYIEILVVDPKITETETVLMENLPNESCPVLLLALSRIVIFPNL